MRVRVIRHALPPRFSGNLGGNLAAVATCRSNRRRFRPPRPLALDALADPSTASSSHSRLPMTLGKRLLVYSAHDPSAENLTRMTAEWGCMVSTCASMDELRGRVEGAEFDFVLITPGKDLRRIVADNAIEETLKLPLAEVEKRHILRVLASTGGNKTQAARVLGIDTKTLYNKLKSYKSSEQMARKRSQSSGSMSI